MVKIDISWTRFNVYQPCRIGASCD